jgi:hypothetical protein
MSAPSVRLPPRRSLPRDVQVPVLPGLGQRWYDRHGASYWIRRAGLSSLWAFLTALVALILAAVLVAFYDRSLAAFMVVLGIEVVYTLGILAYFAVMAVRHWNDPDLAGQMFSRSGRSRAPGGGRGSAAHNRAGNERAGNERAGPGSRRAVHVLGQTLVALSCLTLGPYLALLLMSVFPETPAERRARLWVAEELRRRGHLRPDS